MSPYICLAVSVPLCVDGYAYVENGDAPVLKNGDKTMKHYGVAEWVDLARGLVSDEDGLSMRSHLAYGCGECEDLATFCESLNAVRQQMETSLPPESLVRNAKAIFPMHAVVEPQRAFRLP